MNASDAAAIAAFLSCMSSTTITSPTLPPETSTGSSATGMTPRTRPPFACAVVDTAPIKPTLPPPYTSRDPRDASSAPSDLAASANSGRSPALEPQ
eukprot:31441-Pelagococcus_subviridis.AAC.3